MGFNRVKENKDRHYGKANAKTSNGKRKLEPVKKPKFRSYHDEY